MDQHQFTAIQWRKRLERKGWISLRRRAPAHGVIEYHVIYRGYLYSGRCNTGSLNGEGSLVVGSTEYLLRRADLIIEGVWRRSKRPKSKLDRICRPWQT